MPEDMMIGEGFSGGALGVWMALVIAWLRERGFLSSRDPATTKFLTLAFSYIGALVAAVGIHWTFNGDFLAGGTMTIHWPDANHMLSGAVTFASNIAGQKGYAQLNRIGQCISIMAAAAQPPDPNEERRKKLQAELEAIPETPKL